MLGVEPLVTILLYRGGSAFSLNQHRQSGTHENKKIRLGLAEIDFDDVTNSVCGIDQRPHVLLGLAKFDNPFPWYQYPRVERDRIHDDENFRPLALHHKRHVLRRKLNFLKPRLKGFQKFVKGIRQNDVNRLRYKMRADVRDETCRFVDSIVGNGGWRALQSLSTKR